MAGKKYINNRLSLTNITKRKKNSLPGKKIIKDRNLGMITSYVPSASGVLDKICDQKIYHIPCIGISFYPFPLPSHGPFLCDALGAIILGTLFYIWCMHAT